jgi:hypothetical protein
LFDNSRSIGNILMLLGDVSVSILAPSVVKSRNL